MTSQRAECTLAFSVKTRSISGFIKTSQSLRWAWWGRGEERQSLTVDEDLFQYSWEDGQQNHTEQDQPEHPQSTPPLTWETGGPEQKGMRLINQSMGQSVIRGTVFICLHAAYPAICWLCSSALHAAGGFFFFMLPYCLQNCKTCLELRPFQLVILHPKCQPLKPLQKKGRGATACVIKYFR